MLLGQLGLAFKVAPADIDETPRAGEPAAEYVERLAREKAAAGTHENRVVLAADTTVVLDGQILGKPADEAEAESMLSRLSGREHEVITGVAIRKGAEVYASTVTTRVNFAEVSADERASYIASGEPMDKAGAYGIQGYGEIFVAGINGSYSNVVGLPLRETVELLRQAGIEVKPGG